MAEQFGTPIILQRAPSQPVPQCVLIDRVTGEIYPWPLNYTEEDPIRTLGRRLTRSGISAAGKLIATRKVTLIKHPSHPGPVHLVLHGSLTDHSGAQYNAFVRFFRECDDRTFDYIDASGDSYHVVIAGFDARRKLSASHVDGSYFTYSLEVEVIDVNSGALQGYAV
jgi:hypothetical protein